MKARNEEIFVKVIRTGYIPQLGICGPIPNPIKITRGTVHSMLVSGIDVYQYFPETHRTEKLTIHTVFGDTKKEEAPNTVETKKDVKVSESVNPVTFSGVQKVEEPKKEEQPKVDETVKEDVKEEVKANTPDTNTQQNQNKNNNKNHK